MAWFLITILAYFLFATVSLVDKYLLRGSIPNYKIYAFYSGILQILAVLLIPFAGFFIPGVFQIALALAAGAIFVLALFWFFKGLSLFETSKIVPAIGGFIPLFSIGLTYLFSLGRESLSSTGFVAFILLVSGSVVITLEKTTAITVKSLKISLISAFLFALYFVLVKYLYLGLPFLVGYIWLGAGGFLMAVLIFLFFKKEIGKEIFGKKEFLPKKTITLFLSNQAAGVGGNILQNWAIFLAPLAYVAVINALQGIQYVFLFIFTTILSLKFPKILKEEISKAIILQKIAAILLIGGGLTLLAIK